MNKNIRIAKELIRIAKNLVSSEEMTAKYDIKHPFSFTKKSQALNALKDGKESNAILITYTENVESAGKDRDCYELDHTTVDDGKIIYPPNFNDKKNKILSALKKELNNPESDYEFSTPEKWTFDSVRNYPCFPDKISVDGEDIFVCTENK